MRYCLHCDHTFNPDGWSCPACGLAPPFIGGFPCFAPELATGNTDYDAAYFPLLVAVEDESFWFQARNRLVLWAMDRFFPRPRTLLEIGVGTGFATRALRAALPEAHIRGSDIHVEGLRFASERLKGSVDLFQMDARRIPFREEFDVVCLFDVLEHVDDDEAVLREIGRSLKPAGGLLLTVPQHMFLWGPLDERAYHKRRYGRHELSRKVRAAGFEVLCKTSFVSVLLPLQYVSRLRSRWSKEHDIIDEVKINAALDRVFRTLLAGERALIRSGLRLPFGGSQLLAARRRL